MSGVAILGWGSLLWCQGSLLNDGDWRRDGPWLPIEFARTSNLERRDNKRPYLSLVLHSNAGLIRTYWDMSRCTALDEACENLRVREGCTKVEGRIGYLSKTGAASFREMTGLGQRIKEWADSKPELDAVIWTDLRWKLDTVDSFRVEHGLTWLEGLRTAGEDDTAQEYVRKAPSQTDTCLRRQAREQFGWADISIGL
jgi:hypothetical protein